MYNNNVKYKIIFLRKLVLKKTIYVQGKTPPRVLLAIIYVIYATL